jgi:hypothetical protein
MNKNKILQVLGFTLLLVSLFVLAGFQSAVAAQSNFDSDPAIDADTARWVALGERYKELEEAEQRRADASTARWVAMGEAYAELAAAQSEAVAGSVNLDEVDPADRKFYTNAWEFEGVPSQGLISLDEVDPADRKFYTNEWVFEGVPSPGLASLDEVDPADRKFYMNDYYPILAAVEELSIITQALAIAD